MASERLSSTNTKTGAGVNSVERKPFAAKTIGLLAAPVLLLAGVIALFLWTNGAGLSIEPAAPIENATIDRTILRPGKIEVALRNDSPQEITIAAAAINDAIWPFAAAPNASIPRLGRSTFTFDYMWVEGEAYNVVFFTSNSIPITTDIPVATETATPTGNTLLSFLLIGLYVGVIPVFLGMFWFPALKQLGPRWMMFLMAVTAGLLIFLGIDATNEAFEKAALVGGPFQGVGLIGIGVVVTFLLLEALSRRRSVMGRSESDQRLSVARTIALGIGLHNLGEGLAIGAAYSIGEAALGTFLVIGFIIQNITEGLGIIVPVLKDRPAFKDLAFLGLIGGAPAILGAFVGGLIYSPILAVLFLAVGAGAVFQVVYEISKLIQHDSVKRPMPMTIFSGVTAGMLMLFATGLLIK